MTVEKGRYKRSIVAKVFRKYYSDLSSGNKDNKNYVLEVIKEEERSKSTAIEREIYRIMKSFYDN